MSRCHPAHVLRLASYLLLGAIAAPLARADSFTVINVDSIPKGDITSLNLTSGGVLAFTDARAGSFLFTPPSTLTSVNPGTNLTYDSGASCTPTDTSAFLVAEFGVCNNGREAFLGSTDGTHFGVYDGSSPTSNLVFPGVGASIALNSIGDIGFAVQTNNTGDQFVTVYEAVPTTTTASPVPEPSSWMLLGTGLLAAAGAFRRRFA